MRALSFLERKKLCKSPFVTKTTEKSISFTPEFKQLMLKGPDEGLSRTEYFNKILQVECFSKKYVDSALNRWKKEDKFKSLPKSKRGRKKDLNKMSIDELKAENALQREMLAELKKIHGLTDEDTFGF